METGSGSAARGRWAGLWRPRHPLERGVGWLQRAWRWAAFRSAVLRRDHGFLEETHARFWRDAAAEPWYERSDHRFESWFLAHHEPFAEALLRVVRSDPRLQRLYEIGTGNGRLLEHLAGRLPGLRELVGLDLNAGRIERNRRGAADPRLRFVCADAGPWLSRCAEPGSVFLTNAGVLEYFGPEALADLVDDAVRLAPSVLAVIEPLAPDLDLEREPGSRPFGPERSFSHNYPLRFRAAGFEIVHQRELELRGHRILELVAHRPA